MPAGPCGQAAPAPPLGSICTESPGHVGGAADPEVRTDADNVRQPQARCDAEVADEGEVRKQYAGGLATPPFYAPPAVPAPRLPLRDRLGSPLPPSSALGRTTATSALG